MSDTRVNKEHKDRLFSFIFGKEKNKGWTLSLYNAVNHSDYKDPGDIEINTLDDSLYMGMKNDVSFLLYSSLNLYEHQSTFNPNMPVRQLIYLATIYDKYIKREKLNIYSSSRIRIPVPKLVTFYNGTTDAADETELYLSDLFPENIDISQADVSVKVKMLNINYGHNKELLNACAPLYEYAWFIEQVRKNAKNMVTEDAVKKSLNDMPDSFQIKNFLTENRSEVEMMCLTEYDEAETMNMFKEEGRLEGRQEGRLEEHNSSVRKLAEHYVKENPSLSMEEALKKASDILR